MSLVVTTGAMCMCSFGTTPGNLTSTNNMTVLAEGKPVLVITDAAPMVNISSCGMCSSLANPQVAAATAAAATQDNQKTERVYAWIGNDKWIRII